MQGNFSYHNPTRLHFGKDALQNLKDELALFGPVVMLTYGAGSIKRNGIYDQVVAILQAAEKTIVEAPGVMANPTLEKLHEGVRIARENNVDLILAVGGGSTIDYAKGVAASAYFDGDPWETFYVNQGNPAPDARLIPVGSILTMVGTGSEMNGGSVITNTAQNLKISKAFDARLMPRFTLLNPTFTYSVPQYQMVAGIFDIMSHILEQYLSGSDDNTSDYIAEGLMRSLVHSSYIAVENPQDYEARSNIMWTATWALNTLLSRGKPTDWMPHMMGKSVGAYTDATHGMTLAAVSLAYYRHILDAGLHQFVRFATNVWNINPAGKTDRQVAEEGLQALEAWMRHLGLVMNLTDLGVTPTMLDDLARGTIITRGGYKVLSFSEIVEVFRASL